MSEIPKQLQTLLEELGISHKSATRYRFGGIVGKIALICIAGFAAMVGTAKYLPGAWVQIGGLGLVALVLLLVVRWVLSYANAHPQSATLEGTEIILWQHQQMLLAAKDLAKPPNDGPLMTDPSKPPLPPGANSPFPDKESNG